MSEDLTERVRTLTRNYNDEAEVYERVWAPILRDCSLPLLDRLPPHSETLLDVGAGVGVMLESLRGRFPGAHVVGLDRAENMLRHAGAAFDRMVADAHQLPLRDGWADAATMLFMLFHLADPPAALREVRRTLRTDGVIATATWAPEQTWPQMDLWHDLLTERGAPPPSSVLSRHELTDEPEKIEGLLRDAGFRDVESWKQEFEHRWDTDAFIDFATGMALPKRRLDSLPEGDRTVFVEEARVEIERLPAGARVYRPVVVLGWGRA